MENAQRIAQTEKEAQKAKEQMAKLKVKVVIC